MSVAFLTILECYAARTVVLHHAVDHVQIGSVLSWILLPLFQACVDGGFSCSHRHVGGVCHQRGALHDRFFLSGEEMLNFG